MKKTHPLLTVMLIALFAVLCFGVLTTLSGDEAFGQGRGDKAPATQALRDSTIELRLFSPTLRDTLAFQSATGNVAIADCALAVKGGVLVVGHFKSTAQDSFFKLLVDSADYARFLRAGAITSRNAFTVPVFDSLVGGQTPPYSWKWIKYAGYSDSTGTAAYADSAGEAGMAEYALKYIGTDPVPEADHATTADYADVAGSAISQQGYFTAAQWDSIHDSTDVWVSVDDTNAVSTRALTIAAGAVDSLIKFSTTVRDSYLVTKAYRQSLNEVITNGAALSSTNPVVDSTGMVATMVAKRSPTQTIQIGFGSGAATAKGDVMLDTSGTGNDISIRLISPLGEDTTVFKDSSAVAAMINTTSDADSLDYVGRGSSSVPGKIHIAASSPSTTNLDLWVDTSGFGVNDTAIWKIYSEGGWKVIGDGGGGGGSGTELYQDRFSASLDGDSFLVRSRRDTTFSDLHVGDDSGDTLFAKRVNPQSISIDTIQALSGGSDSVYVRDKWISSVARRWQIGSSTTNSLSPTIYALSFMVGTNSGYSFYVGTSSSSPIFAYAPVPQSTGAIGCGSIVNGLFSDPSTYAWSSIPSYSMIAKDSITIGAGYSFTSPSTYIKIADNSTGLTLYNRPLNVSGDNVSVTNGNVALSGGQFSVGGSSWDSDKITLASSDYVTMSSSSYINMPYGARIKIKGDRGDTTVFADVDDGTPYYVLRLNEKNSLVEACPQVSDSNPVVTEEWMRSYQDWSYIHSDTLLFHKLNARKFTYFIPSDTCSDTLFARYPQDHVLIPRTPMFPWNDGGVNWTSPVIEPWQIPIDPPPPTEIVYTDSSENTFRVNDPNPGFPEHIFYVSDRYTNDWGWLTGKYQTIQAVLDSLVHFECGYDSKSADGIAPDTFTIATTSATTARQISVFRGSVQYETNIQDTLPTFIRQPGSWVKFENSGFNARERWCQIERWITPFSFTVMDTVVGRVSWSTSTTDLSFAQKAIIEILPPVEGGVVSIDTTVFIYDYSPVCFRGYSGRDNTVITNRKNATPGFSTLFSCVNSETNMVTGMPIEFDGISFWADSVDEGGYNSMLKLGGVVKLKDCYFANRTQLNVTYHQSYMVEYLGYNSSQRRDGDLNAVISENCVFVGDSDSVPIMFNLDSVSFQANNCVFSVSGDSGRVLSKFIPTPYSPMFTHCQFHLRTENAGFAGGIAASAGDSVMCMGSIFVGGDPNTSLGVAEFSGGWKSFITNVTNDYTAAFTQAPVLATKANAPFNLPFIPSK